MQTNDSCTDNAPNYLQKFHFWHWNLNGIATHNVSKVSLVQAMATTHGYDVIWLSLMFLNFSFNSLDDWINTEGYNLVRANHPNNNKRGGVCMYFKEHLPILRHGDLCNLPECLVTKTRMGKKSLCILTFLHSVLI